MKRLFCVLLCACVLVGLTACGAANETPETTAAKAEFQVGYARVNITPETPTGLAGHGNTDQRKHTEVLDYIYLTCIAMTDTEGNTFLFYAADLCTVEDAIVSSLREKVEKETGVPGKQIMLNYTHTHSAPTGAGIPDIVLSAAVEGATKALADRKPATVFVGTAETEGINFVRHYYMSDGVAKGDNHGMVNGRTYVSHTTEADEEMRIIRFVREGAKEVIMVNWQTHNHITGGQNVTSLSADTVGAFRSYLEAEYDCYMAYYQGGAGNINPTSKFEELNANKTNPRDYRVHGELMVVAAMEAIKNSVQVETGPFKHTYETYSCATNKEDMDMANDASTVLAYSQAGHNDVETMEYGLQFGIYSIYHARSIVGRGSTGATLDIEIHALSFGDIGMVFAPYEMFDTNAKFIRENSPYAMTFACGYSNGKTGYFPSLEAWEYGCYEADTSQVARGTAEQVADRFVELLVELHG